MSLAIVDDDVISVLLADGWHEVVDQSFAIDAYEFLDRHDRILVGGGTVDGIPATGASWREDIGNGHTVRVCVPLTSILAVREDID